MAEKEKPRTPKEILSEVLRPVELEALWTKNYFPAFPISFGAFELGSVMPALFYLCRRGVRRGAGSFRRTYAPDGNPVSVAGLSAALVEDGAVALQGRHETQVIADLLLCTTFINKWHATERDADVMRISANHYLASWFDLPIIFIHLRLVPELLLTALVQQPKGEQVRPCAAATPGFAVTGCYEDHALLRPFSAGMSSAQDDLHECWSESATVDVDQLLCIRIAQKLKHAPVALSNALKGAINNQWPVAVAAMRIAGDDMAIFLRTYADGIPRKALLSMLESGFALGLSCMFLDSMQRMQKWMRDGRLPLHDEHVPCPLFIDGSNGSDRALRAVAEDCADLRMRGVPQFSLALAQLRILDLRARAQRLHEGIAIVPDPTTWINLLGDVMHGRHARSEWINEHVIEVCQNLAEALVEDSAARTVAEYLMDSTALPVERLGLALTQMMGGRVTTEEIAKWLDSVWRTDEPDGMVRSRRRRDGKSRRVARSFVLSDVLLDFLVHRHLVADDGTRRHLSLREFLRILRERYGLYVDRAPAGQAISADLLARNRRLIEERLRDLGLLVSVNDADGMKFLRPRFAAARSGGAS
jgi:hypothetical protein